MACPILLVRRQWYRQIGEPRQPCRPQRRAVGDVKGAKHTVGSEREDPARVVRSDHRVRSAYVDWTPLAFSSAQVVRDHESPEPVRGHIFDHRTAADQKRRHHGSTQTDRPSQVQRWRQRVGAHGSGVSRSALETGRLVAGGLWRRLRRRSVERRWSRE